MQHMQPSTISLNKCQACAALQHSTNAPCSNQYNKLQCVKRRQQAGSCSVLTLKSVIGRTFSSATAGRANKSLGSSLLKQHTHMERALEPSNSRATHSTVCTCQTRQSTSLKWGYSPFCTPPMIQQPLCALCTATAAARSNTEMMLMDAGHKRHMTILSPLHEPQPKQKTKHTIGQCQPLCIMQE